MQLIDLWIAAANAKLGISITTDDRMLLRQHLYRARMEATNRADLDDIVMVLPEQADQIWLVHREGSLGTNNQSNFEPLF